MPFHRAVLRGLFPAVAIALFSLPLDAAVRFRMTERTVSGHLVETATIVLDGSQWRLEREGGLPGPRLFHVLLGSGDEVIALDLEREAWFDHGSGSVPRGVSLWDLPGVMEPSQVKRLEVKVLPPTEDSLDGVAVERHDLRVTYRVSNELFGHRLEANVTAVITLRAIDRDLPLPRALDLRRVETRLPTVGAALAEKLDAIAGLAVQREIGIMRQIVGGPPISGSALVMFDSFETIDTPAGIFERPAGWVEQPPLLLGPGVGP